MENVKALKNHWDKVSYDARALRDLLNKAVIMAIAWDKQAAKPEIDARREMNQSSMSLDDITEFIAQGIGKKNMDELRVKIAEFCR